MSYAKMSFFSEKTLACSCYYTCGLDRKYRVLVSVVCLSVYLSVCKHDNSKNKWSRILKFEYIVGYEKSSDEFDIGHCPIKVKVTV